MTNFFNLLHGNYNNTIKFAIFDYLKTGNPAFDAILSTLIISWVGYIINYIYENNMDSIITNLSFDDIKSRFYKRNCVIIEGKKCFTTNAYTISNVTSIYSNRFKAIWNYIIQNIENNKTIYQIKESHTNFQASENNDKKKNLDLFMVFQNKRFKIDENIYVNTSVQEEESRDEKEKVRTKTDKITIRIYSYVYSVSYLKNYIDNITNTYLASIKNNRHNKKFIYKLEKNKFDADNESKLDCWREDLFESTRSFNNIFFL